MTAEGASRVDAELIVLRKRIGDLKLQERNYVPPQHWMKWEKQWSVTYASDVCEAMGLLQNKLMNTRPCTAMAALAMISLSVPAYLLLLLSRFLWTHLLWSFSPKFYVSNMENNNRHKSESFVDFINIRQTPPAQKKIAFPVCVTGILYNTSFLRKDWKYHILQLL